MEEYLQNIVRAKNNLINELLLLKIFILENDLLYYTDIIDQVIYELKTSDNFKYTFSFNNSYFETDYTMAIYRPRFLLPKKQVFFIDLADIRVVVSDKVLNKILNNIESINFYLEQCYRTSKELSIANRIKKH